jgi:hypothetical protein
MLRSTFIVAAGLLVLTGSLTLTGCSGVSSSTQNPGNTAGALAVSPASLNFGSVAVGSSSTLTATLSASNAEVTVSSATPSGAGYSIRGISFPVTLAAGHSASFTVVFTPTAPGSSAGSVSFASNASDSSLTQSYTGNGAKSSTQMSGSLALSPSSLNFGNVAVGSSSSLTGTLSATTADVTVSSAAWSGSGYLVSGITFPATVPAGKSATYTVTFTPPGSGSASGSVSFLSNASDSSVTQSLTGDGTQSSPYSVALSWNASSSAVNGYNIYRGTQSGGPYSKLNSALLPSTSYSDPTVQSGATYYYVSTAVANNVESVYSNQTAAAIP